MYYINMKEYDINNVFSKILQGLIPCNRVYESDFSLAFYDISPRSKIHILVIPKGTYTDFYDFQTNALPEEILDFWQSVANVTEMNNIKDTGFRLISNCGVHSNQEVPHFHVHIVGGQQLNSW